MTVDLNINLATLASIIVSAIAILNYARMVKNDVNTMRTNDLMHIDAKLDKMTERIDGVYKLLVERKK